MRRKIDSIRFESAEVNFFLVVVVGSFFDNLFEWKMEHGNAVVNSAILLML